MKILRLHTLGFRGFADRVFDFRKPGSSDPHDVCLVTGGSGSGKTNLLEAIIAAKEDVGAYGAPAERTYVRAGSRTARLEATWLLSPAERQRARAGSTIVMTTSIFGEGAPPVAAHPEELRALFREHSPDSGRAKVEYFHAERALPSGRAARGQVDPAPAASVRWRLTANNEKYRAVRAYLADAARVDNEAMAENLRRSGLALEGQLGAQARIREATRPFLHGKVFDGVDSVGGTTRARFVSQDGSVLDLDELSASERQGILFAVTFLSLGLSHSIVLIDEPELHVHQAGQQQFLASMRELGRDNQILVATTSEPILGAFPRGQVIDLSNERT